MVSGVNEEQKTNAEADTSCAVYYFNAKASYWEPAVEKFVITVIMNQIKNHSKTTLKFPHPVSLNFSSCFFKILNDFNKLWLSSTKKSKKFQEQMAKGDKDALRQSNMFTMSRSTMFHQFKQNDIMLLDGDEANPDVVAPYGIRNLTDRPIKVTPVGKSADKNDLDESMSCQIEIGKKKGIATSFSDTLEREDDSGRVQHRNTYVRIEFASRSMRNISKLRLNSSFPVVMHEVFLLPKNPGTTTNMNREVYALHSQLEDNKRLLTVRTQFILINKTGEVYRMRQFFVNKIVENGKEKKEVMIVHDANILPGEAFPIPDDRDVSVCDRLKICIKPINCKKWSDEFKISALKEKLECNLNITWCHYKTFSVLRKE